MESVTAKGYLDRFNTGFDAYVSATKKVGNIYGQLTLISVDRFPRQRGRADSGEGGRMGDFLCSCGNITRRRLTPSKIGSMCGKCRSTSNAIASGAVAGEGRFSRKRLARWSRMAQVKYGECLICGDADDLETHHVTSKSVSVASAYDPSNAAVLCHDCHRDFHDAYGFGNNTPEQFASWLLS